MKRVYKKNEKIQIGLFTLSCFFVLIGVLFLLNAMGVAKFFPSFCAIGNIIAKYIVVLLFMISGIMLFSNVSFTIENHKWRKGLVIGVTTFSTVLTIPLVYVFCAIFGYQAHGTIDAFGAIMGVDKIAAGFVAWCGTGAGLYVLYVVMLIVSIIFITFPLVTGVLAIKGKTISIGKQPNGKFGIGLKTLPVLAKLAVYENCPEYACNCGCQNDGLENAACDKDTK